MQEFVARVFQEKILSYHTRLVPIIPREKSLFLALTGQLPNFWV